MASWLVIIFINFSCSIEKQAGEAMRQCVCVEGFYFPLDLNKTTNIKEGIVC